MTHPTNTSENRRLAEQRTKLKDIFWHLRWLGDLIEHDPHNEGVRFLDFCRRNLHRSGAQAFQDLFALYSLGEERKGYFVEFGATDGVTMSNTILLERDYGWDGIVAEPARVWRERLKANRTCHVDFRCVFETTGETIAFNEVGTGEISSIAALSDRDGLAEARKTGAVYTVETVALHDLLRCYNAPRSIDYLSLDTEGSEFSILRSFDFNAFEVKLITVEHNFVEETRDSIHRLLTGKGFARKFESFSGFDDWYLAENSRKG